MEFFRRAKAVRLRSQHKKFLVATEDEEGIKQSRNGSSKAARWVVESVDGKPNIIRLKSCQSWKYLAASEDPFLLGMTGKKVVQASPRLRVDVSVEWEPLKEGAHVKLRTHRGNFLRANGGVPPWMNSVTHDVPSRSATQDWILWTVDVVEVAYESTVGGELSNVVDDLDPGRGSVGSWSSVSEVRSEDYGDVGSPAHSVVSLESCVDQDPMRNSRSTLKSSSNSEHSNSFNKLKSMLDGLQDLLDDPKQDKETTSYSSSYSSSQSHQQHLSLEVKMAKQTLKELNNLDLTDILSSDRYKKIEKAITILIADEKSSTMSSENQLLSDLTHLETRLKSLRREHESATQDLDTCASFTVTRMGLKTQLKNDAAKAHHLQTMEVEYDNMLVNAKAEREELLKKLEEVDNNIREVKSAQVENIGQIEELISRIGETSERVREMDKKEKLLQERKFEAEGTLEKVNNEWVKLKMMFQDII